MLRERGCYALVVNPEVESIDDVRCFVNLDAVRPPVDGVLVMTSPAVTSTRLCVSASVLDSAGLDASRLGCGAVSPQAVEFRQEHGIKVVTGECPYMFFPHGEWFHGVHGFINRIAGKCPA
jgi:predicted CoA-binding protein